MFLIACGMLQPPPAGWAQTEEGGSSLLLSQEEAAEAALQELEPIPSAISLEPGEVRSLTMEELTRVAVGDPKIADVSLVSSNEVILQGIAVGETNLILWDRSGKHEAAVQVVDRAPERTETALQQVIRQLNLPGIRVNREGDKFFLVGEVPRKEDMDRLEQVASAYKGVTSLVTIPLPPLPAAGPPPSVKLTVQLIEMNRAAQDKIGVDWDDSVTVTETTFNALGPADVSIAGRLGQAFRLGALTRAGADSVLNMLVSSGKARILTEPKLVAASGKQATTFLGVEVPVVTSVSVSAGVVSQDIEFKKTGVEMTFTPTVLEDQRSIQLALEASVASVDNTVAITVSGTLIPGFKTRQAQTEIVTDSGQSVFISGLLQDDEKRNLSQLPALGSIPVLGTLFRSTEFVGGRTELVIVVTPEIMAEGAPMTTERAFALEQALAAPGTPAERPAAGASGLATDPTVRYAMQVQERIAAALRYPAQERQLGLSGQVTLRLHLSRAGALEQAALAASSGIAAFDEQALSAAKQQAPYPAFPPEIAQPDLWLELPVLFRP
jgi:pilus assembly protein CpaC